MSVLVVSGAGGWLGRCVCLYLKKQGHTVIALDRNGTPDGPWDRFVPIDLLADDGGGGWKQEIKGSAAFIHCAGYAHHPNETPEEVKKFFKINRDGTQLVINGCREMSVPRFVYLGTIAAYDWSLSQPVREDAPKTPVTAYARSKIEGEQLVVESGLDWRVVRLATVFGGGDRANFSKMASALRRRRFVVPGDGGAKKSAIPVDLAAEIICEMALRDHVAHPLINVALPKAPTLTDIVNGFTKTCGFPAPLHIPILMLKTLALAGDLCSRIRSDFPLTTTNVKKLTTSTEIDVERLQAVFPGRVWPSFEECLQKHADWYRNLV